MKAGSMGLWRWIHGKVDKTIWWVGLSLRVNKVGLTGQWVGPYAAEEVNAIAD